MRKRFRKSNSKNQQREVNHKTRVDKTIDWFKNHKVLSVFISISLIIIAFASLKESIFSLFTKKEKTPIEKILEKDLANQNKLLDANRKNQIIELSSILSEVNTELTSKENKTKEISEPLVNRIISFSKIVKPYSFLKNNLFIDSPLSPERGQLFLAIALSNIKKEVKDKLLTECDFTFSDLSDVKFKTILIESDFSDIDLSFSSFENTSFEECCLIGVKFNNANLTNSFITNCDFISCDFSEAKLKSSEIVFCDMPYCKFVETDFENSMWQLVNFQQSEFYRGNYLDIYIQPSVFNDEPIIYLDQIKMIEENWFEYLDRELMSAQLINQRTFYVQDTFIKGGFIKPDITGIPKVVWTDSIEFIELTSKLSKYNKSDTVYAKNSNLTRFHFKIEHGVGRTIQWYREIWKKNESHMANSSGEASGYPWRVNARLVESLKKDSTLYYSVFHLSDNIVLAPGDTNDHTIVVIRKGTKGFAIPQ